MICLLITGPSFEEALQQIAFSAAAGADLIELRTDFFAHLSLNQLSQLRHAATLPVILTIKNNQNPQPYLSLKPNWIDLEWDSSFITQIPISQLILSYHNFDETPHNLDTIYTQMKQTPAAFYKIALKANSTLDCLRLLSWAKTKQDPQLICVSMGKQGQLSRILAPALGFPFTYASLKEEENTFGQLPINTLLHTYRYRAHSPTTALYGLIGDPVEQSISQHTHNAFFESRDIDALYVKMQVTTEELPLFLKEAKQLNFKGLSVTMPLKEAILPYLDHIDMQAQQIGAVNTLAFLEGKLFGYNTDSKGALDAIEKKQSVHGKQFVILGAGGAAKAIAYEAKRRGALVTIVNRTPERAKQVAAAFGCRAAEKVPRYDILVNSTPVGMPVVEEEIMPDTLVMDIGIQSDKKPFLQTALQKGAQVVYGIEMFQEQALGQYAIWGLI